MIHAMVEAAPAGFWIRAIAFVIDGVVLWFVQSSYTVAASLLFGADPESSSPMVGLFTLAFAALYTTVLHAAGGQTLGKLLARVRVVAEDGDVVAGDREPPDGSAAFLRWLGYFLSVGTFGFGFLMAGLRTDKRGLHDLIAGTRVERVPRVRPIREEPPPPETTPDSAPAELTRES
jgi:uncharacterized RDD family membrane protein YckC